MNRIKQAPHLKPLKQVEGNPIRLGSFDLNNTLIQNESISKNLIKKRIGFFTQLKKLPDPSIKEKTWRKSKIGKYDPKKLLLLPDKDLPKNKSIKVENYASSQSDFAGSLHITPEEISIKLDEKLVNLGVVFSDLRTVEKKYPHILEKIMGKIITSKLNKFSLLTLTKPQFGAILYLPKGIHIEKPIQTLFSWEGAGFLHTFYSLILLEENSSVTVIQQFNGKSLNSSKNTLSRVTEIQLGRRAELNYTEVNAFDNSWWNLVDEYTIVKESGKINWTVFGDGGYYCKTFLGVNLAGKASRAKITGVLIPSGESQIDFDTFQRHSGLHTTSDLLFRNAMADEACSNWSGMIRVEKDAMKADGYQSHQSLMLCGNPQMESNPGLEILTDDVKCSHGVTVGDINEEQIFYLQTRGFSESQARELIAAGFLESSLTRIEDELSKKLIRKKIQRDLSRLLCQ